jgi:hypothetical protein
VNRLARALKEVAEAEHVYRFVFGDGLTHLHVVLAPRYAGTPREYWGVRLREWPDAPRAGPAGGTRLTRTCAPTAQVTPTKRWIVESH